MGVFPPALALFSQAPDKLRRHETNPWDVPFQNSSKSDLDRIESLLNFRVYDGLPGDERVRNYAVAAPFYTVVAHTKARSPRVATPDAEKARIPIPPWCPSRFGRRFNARSQATYLEFDFEFDRRLLCWEVSLESWGSDSRQISEWG
jgi:hypothetical protein